MSLIVASVYTDSPRNSKWYELQNRYLSETTDEFDHCVVLNNLDNVELFKKSIIISKNNYTFGSASQEHTYSLNQIIEYFRSKKYDNYLILDNDCFPIKKNWLSQLLTESNKFPCAAVVRLENLDLFPHPCAFLIKGKFIFEPWLDFTPKSIKNLLGTTISDPGSGIPLHHCFPLVRSNSFNHHPLLYGIYHHMFYHNGCGSRVVHARMTDYFPSKPKVDHDKLFQSLVENPDCFIEKLKTGECKTISFL